MTNVNSYPLSQIILTCFCKILAFDAGIDYGNSFEDFLDNPYTSNRKIILYLSHHNVFSCVAYAKDTKHGQGEEFRGDLLQNESFNDDDDEDIPRPDQGCYIVEESRGLELQEQIKKTGMSKLPSRNIDNESDIFDFLFFDEMRPDELLESLECQILTISEAASVYLRIGKLFNFVCRKLDTLLDAIDIVTESDKLDEANSFLDLFHRCVSAVRYTNFSNVCLMPEFRMELDVTSAFLNKLLIVVSNHLDQLPANSDKLFLSLIAFIMHPPDPYVIQLERVPELVLEHMVQSLPSGPNRNYFKFLSVMFLSSPPNLVPQYVNKIILPLKSVVEVSLQQTSPKDKFAEEEKMQTIMNPLDNESFQADDEMLFQVFRFFIIAVNNDLVRKQFIKQNLHVALYGLLRNNNPVFGKAPTKASVRVMKLITTLLSNLTTDLESDQLKKFQERIYDDICTCIEKMQTDFILSCIVPILAGASFKPAALCLHLEDELETSLNKYRSKGSLAGADNTKLLRDDKALNSEALTNQERSYLLQNIQKLSLDPKGNKKGSEIKISACEWRRSFKVDFSTQYPMNTKPLHEDLQKSDGVLLIFQCLVNDEICKIGAFCSEKFVKLYPWDNTYNYNYGGNNNKAAFVSPENFLFYYSQHTKLHFKTAEQSASEDQPQETEIDLNIDNLFNEPVPTTQKPHATASKPTAGKIILSPASLITAKSLPTANTNTFTTYPTIHEKTDPKKKVFVDFSDNKITLTFNGINLIEYFPINPDNNKVAANLQGMVSEEEKRGQNVHPPQYDPDSFSFIQSMECWVLSYPKDPKLASGEELIMDLHSISKGALIEHLSYLRSDPVTLAPRDFTIDQIFSVLFRGYEKTFAEKITCKIVPQEQIDLSHQAQKLIDMYQGSQQNILDLFLSTKEGVKLLKEKLNLNEAVLNEKFIALSKKDSKIIRELLAPERLAAIVKKTKLIAAMNNKQFLTDYLDFSQQIDIFMKIEKYHDALVENEYFFYTLVHMIDTFIKNDIYNYKTSCVYLKLQQRLYGTLVRIIKAKGSHDHLSNVNVTELIHLLLQKITEMYKLMDSGNLSMVDPQDQHSGKIGDGLLPDQQNDYFYTGWNSLSGSKNDKAGEENVATKKKARELEQMLSKKILKHVMSILAALFERGLSLQAKKEVAAKNRQFKLIVPISKFIGDLEIDNLTTLQSPFYKQLTGKLSFLLKELRMNFLLIHRSIEDVVG